MQFNINSPDNTWPSNWRENCFMNWPFFGIDWKYIKIHKIEYSMSIELFAIHIVIETFEITSLFDCIPLFFIPHLKGQKVCSILFDLLSIASMQMEHKTIHLLTPVIFQNKWEILSTSFRSFGAALFFSSSSFVVVLNPENLFHIIIGAFPSIISLPYRAVVQYPFVKVAHNKSVFHLTFQFTEWAWKKLHQQRHRSNK